MLNTIVIILYLAALIIITYLGTLLIAKGSTKNKILIFACFCSVFLHLLGSLLEVTSINEDEAFTASKILYIGSSFIQSFYLLFLLEFLDYKKSKIFFFVPILLFSAISIFISWNTGKGGILEGWLYNGYTYYNDPVVYLQPNPGPFYYVYRGFMILYAISGSLLIVTKIIKWNKRYRKSLIIILLAQLIPTFVETLVFGLKLSGFEIHVYLTPLALVVTLILLYILATKYDLFEIVPKNHLDAIDSIKDCYILLDSNCGYFFSNKSADHIFPGLEGFPKGRKLDNLESWPKELHNLLLDNNYTINFDIEKDNVLYHYKASTSTIISGKISSAMLAIMISDVTDTVNYIDQIKTDSKFDYLITNIYNRRYFDDFMVSYEKKLDETDIYYIFMIDIDFFKRVNDTYGHQVGDDVLKVVAQTIKKTIRTNDTLARYGGEEFIVLVDCKDTSTAYALAERVRQNVSSLKINVEKALIKTKISVGISYRSPNQEVNSVIEESDKALYISKNNGRNRVTVYPKK